MINVVTQFAETANASGGIGAFNLNIKEFLFQLITFVLVLLILRRWALPKLISTIDERRQTLEQSLTDAKQTQETLAKAGTKAEEIIAQARVQADEAVAQAKKAGSQIIADAEALAATKAQRIIKEAEVHLDQERNKLRQELRGELAVLVADATEKVMLEKLDAQRDMTLIQRAIKAVAG